MLDFYTPLLSLTICHIISSLAASTALQHARPRGGDAVGGVCRIGAHWHDIAS